MNRIQTSPSHERTPGSPLKLGRLRLLKVFLIAWVLGGVVASARGQEATWKAGVAKAIVTPQTGVRFAG